MQKLNITYQLLMINYKIITQDLISFEALTCISYNYYILEMTLLFSCF